MPMSNCPLATSLDTWLTCDVGVGFTLERSCFTKVVQVWFPRGAASETRYCVPTLPRVISCMITFPFQEELVRAERVAGRRLLFNACVLYEKTVGNSNASAQ